MQDKYTGDIGDYIKYALLRTIMRTAPDKRLGVAWYLMPDEAHKGDGKFTEYLHAPKQWEALDKKLFSDLRDLVCVKNKRAVSEIEKLKILGSKTKFFSRVLENNTNKANAEFRKDWFSSLEDELKDCDIIFCDPDNSIYEGEDYKWGQMGQWKNQPLSEVLEIVKLAKSKTAIFYHHFNRTEKGVTHDMQREQWIKTLEKETGYKVISLRWNKYSPRVFFIVNPTPKIKNALHTMADAPLPRTSNGNPAIDIL